MPIDKSNEYDPILDKLLKIPEKWLPDQKKVDLHIIARKRDAAWISSIIYDYVDDELITANFEVKHSEFSIDMHITLAINLNVEIGLAALTTLLIELRTHAISSWLKHRKKKKERTTKRKNTMR